MGIGIYTQMVEGHNCMCISADTRKQATQVCGVLLDYAYAFTHVRSKAGNGALLYRFDIKIKDINVRTTNDWLNIRKTLMSIC